MQIINTIEIVCSICGKSMPVEKNIDREFEMNRYIFRVMPCACNGKQQPPNKQTFSNHIVLKNVLESMPHCPDNVVVRFVNACFNSQIRTIDGLTRLTEKEFSRIHNVGQQTVKVAREFLRINNANFRDNTKVIF